MDEVFTVERDYDAMWEKAQGRGPGGAGPRLSGEVF